MYNDYLEGCGEICTRLDALPLSISKTEERTRDLLLIKLENTLVDLKREIRSLPTKEEKEQGKVIMQAYQMKLDQYKRRMLMRVEGSGGAEEGKGESEEDMRKRMAGTIEKGRKGVEMLEETRRVLLDTEDQAKEISSELVRQRKQMEGIKEKAHEVGDDLTTANRLLRTMNKRWWA